MLTSVGIENINISYDNLFIALIITLILTFIIYFYELKHINKYRKRD